jgi:hypothetical protein
MTAEENANKLVPLLLPLGFDFYIAALKLKKNITGASQLFSWAGENFKQHNRFAPYWQKWEAQLTEARLLQDFSEDDIIRNLEAFQINLAYRSYLSMAYILFWHIRYNSQINVEKPMEAMLIDLKRELSSSVSPSTIIYYAPGAVNQAPNVVSGESLLKLGVNMEIVLATLDSTIKLFIEAYKDAPPYQPGGIFYPIML